MPAILRVFYASVASPALDKWAVNEILAVSRRTNDRNDVTGCLLFTGRLFAHFLEGREDVVGAAIARIAVDRRHSGLRILHRSHSKLRLYHDCTMGFVYDVGLDRPVQRLLAGDASEQSGIEALERRMRSDSALGSLNSSCRPDPSVRASIDRRRAA